MQIGSPIPKKHARIEIIPLIDIMFFLLASFMMVSLSQTHMKGIKTNLPSNTAPPPNQPKDFTSLRVAAGPVYYIDGQFVDAEALMPRLMALHKQNTNAKVSISAEPMALHGDVIALLDKVRSAGITKVGYQIRTGSAASAANPPGAAPPPPPPPH
jgi:biopolymer transport protein ExbD